MTGEPLVIDDAYFLPPDVEYSINRSFDERHGYRKIGRASCRERV